LDRRTGKATSGEYQREKELQAKVFTVSLYAVNKPKTRFEIEVEAIVRRYLEQNDWKLLRASNALGISLPTARKLATRGGFWPRNVKQAA
jgi:hypothetical protein